MNRDSGRAAGPQRALVKVVEIQPERGWGSGGSAGRERHALLRRRRDGVHGRELVEERDGTAAGTVLVADIWPGNSSLNPTLGSLQERERNAVLLRPDSDV